MSSGLVTSTTTLPAGLTVPAAWAACNRTLPKEANTTSYAHAAAPEKVVRASAGLFRPCLRLDVALVARTHHDLVAGTGKPRGQRMTDISGSRNSEFH